MEENIPVKLIENHTKLYKIILKCIFINRRILMIQKRFLIEKILSILDKKIK
jgi:hypothetical protein